MARIKTIIGDTNRRENPIERFGGPTSPRIPTAYEGSNIPSDFSMPASTIEDVDRAFFNFFNKSIDLQVQVQNQLKKVPVIFSGGERFTLTQSGRPIRDRQGAIVVPVIAIHRTAILQNATPALAYASDPGEIVIKRRLHHSDRRYQQLVNRFGIQNQDNIASSGNIQELTAPGTIAKPGRLATRRNQTKHSLQTALDNPLGDNIYEFLTCPSPDLFTCQYEIIVWTNYAQEMNQIIERILGAYDVGTMPRARVETDKGYWYTAHFDGDWQITDNFDDYSNKQRLIKATTTATVPAYIFASAGAGEPIPIRSFVSAPTISFDVGEANTQMESLANRSPQVGSDNLAFALTDVADVGADGRIETAARGSGIVTKQYIYNPFATDKKGDARYARVIDVSEKGERVAKSYEALILDKISK